MSFELIDLGTAPNSGDGDSLREAGSKINSIISYLNDGIGGPVNVVSSSLVSDVNTINLVDTSSNAVTITLPDVAALDIPVTGITVGIIDIANTFATNNCTVVEPNGYNINHSASDLVISANGAYAKLIFAGATYGWVLA